MKNTNTIGQNIKKRRLELGWTQEELAHKMGYKSKSSINKIELDYTDIPQSKIKKFAEVLMTTTKDLMDWQEQQKRDDAKINIATRIDEDADFFEAVDLLDKLNAEQLKTVASLMQLLCKKTSDEI